MKTGTSLTDAEIIKALECCSKQSCEGCPYNDGTSKCLMETLPRDTLDLINRQQAEIERFQKENNQFADIGKMYSEIRAEAYKEFVEAYKDQIKNYTGMFTDEGFYVSLEAVLSAVDFIFEKLKEDGGT